MEDLAKDSGPGRDYLPDNTPENLQHDFNKKDICKKCGAESYTKGKLCIGKVLK